MLIDVLAMLVVGAAAFDDEWTLLTTQSHGEKYANGGMRSACRTLGGVSYGSIHQFCAVQGQYTQLSTRATPSNLGRCSCLPNCQGICGMGVSFTASVEQGCTCRSGNSTANDASSTSDDSATTLDAGPGSSGTTGWLPGTMDKAGITTYNGGGWSGTMDKASCATKCSSGYMFRSIAAGSTFSIRAECEHDLSGVTFGLSQEFCAVKGNYAQLSSGSASTSMRSTCRQLGGKSS